MGETETSTTVVCDAGPLIHLDELGALDLLTDFDRLLVPPTVWGEVETHRPSALAQPAISLLAITPATNPNSYLHTLFQALSLDTGEREALLLTQEHPQALLITDDAAARLVGELLGFRVHGSIGILIRAIRRRQRTPQEVISLIERIPTHSSLHLRPALLEDIVA